MPVVTNVTCDSSSSDSSDEGVPLDLSWSSMAEKYKIFNDSVHGKIELPALCSKIINTPQFQRLRNLKQLGLCYHVYPAASHNRFEHCIGTSFLAGKYCRRLKENQPELDIDDSDVLCLYVGGLCHDLGHGPFSHTWEHFMKHYDPTYTHEKMSIRMLDFLIQSNDLKAAFEDSGLNDKDLVFIKELILGHPLPGNVKLEGRDNSKYFLYQIVSNDETKIDVDKFDYLLRDCKHLKVKTGFDYERVIDNSRVVKMTDEKGDDIWKITYRKKISDCLADLFNGRFRLHQIAYQHRVTKILEEMIVDGLHAAEAYLPVTGNNGVTYKLSTAYQEISAFMKLTDTLFEIILYWLESGDEAKEIYQRIVTRDLYKSFGYVDAITLDKTKDGALKEFQDIHPNLKLVKTNINFGYGDENPLNNVLFFEKTRPERVQTLKFSPPSKESKWHIVLRAKPTESTEMYPHEIRCSLKNWEKKHNISIYTE